MKCMAEANIPDENTLKEILEDDTGSYPEEACFRKCLYVRMQIVNQDGEINVGLTMITFFNSLVMESFR